MIHKPSLKKPAKMGLGLMVLAFIAYISLGLPDGLLGVAWPSIRHDFALHLDSLGSLMVTVTIGYLASSFFGGRLLAHFRLGTVLAASTFAAGIALLGYVVSPSWLTMVMVGIFAGLGGGGIDVALNTYVASNHGEGLMQWLHASYGVGATAGPVIMTLAMGLTGSWRYGYLVVGLLQLTLMLSFIATASMWERHGNSSSAGHGHDRTAGHDSSMTNTLAQPRVWLSILLFFIYMGIEVAFGAWSYSLLTESRGVPARLAGFWVGSFWGIFTAGRFVAGIYSERIGRSKLILGGLSTAFFATIVLAMNFTNPINLAAVIIIGLAIAPVLPALISGTADRVGHQYASNSIGIQIAAMGLGGAAIPSITGIIAQKFSLEAIPPFMMILTVVLVVLFLFSSISPSPSRGPASRRQQ
jgi:fucose permease